MHRPSPDRFELAATDPRDRVARQTMAQATGGLAPSVLVGAWVDWTLQMAASPGRRAELARLALRHALYLARPAGPPDGSLPQDRRFASPSC